MLEGRLEQWKRCEGSDGGVLRRVCVPRADWMTSSVCLGGGCCELAYVAVDSKRK
jgi:hypothetical protein